MCNYPLIHPGCSVREGKSYPKVSLLNNPPVEHEMTNQKGDLLIRDLWQRGTDSILGMNVVNTDILSKSPVSDVGEL